MSAPERGRPGTWQYLGFWLDGRLHLPSTLAALPVNETDAALALSGEYRGGLHYAVSSAEWHLWDGQSHAPDMSGELEKLCMAYALRYRNLIETARSRVLEQVSEQLPDAAMAAINQAFTREWERWEPKAKYGASLRKAAGQTALLRQLGVTCGVADEHMAERNPGLLNVASGTLNLATLEQRRHAIGDLITYCLPVPYNPEARCPQFQAMLRRMCGGNNDIALYLVKLLGYSLLGDNREQKIVFLSGATGSGKSQLLHIIAEVLGPLAHASQADLICLVRHGRNARTENSIRNKRLVIITETSSFMNIEESQVKRLTGEPWISVNQHYAKREIMTPVTWLIWVATNNMPSLVNFDEAMRRRIIVIPCGPGVPDWEMDPSLPRKILSTEREGILALLAWGARQYFLDGHLAMPEAVAWETERYAVQQDTVAAFVADTMTVGGWGNGIPQSEAWETYRRWATGQSHLGRNEFYARLRSQDGVSYNAVSRRFENVAWNQDWAVKIR
jgi:putative DNA primase/helicase